MDDNEESLTNYYTEVHHLRMLLKMKDDQFKKCMILIQDLKAELEELSKELKKYEYTP